jgi:hypothetical protein
MTKPELTTEEQELVDRVLSNHNKARLPDKESKGKGKDRPRWARLSTWSIFFVILPFILNGIFIIFIMQISSVVGNDRIKVLIESQSEMQMNETSEELGITWLQDFFTIYVNRFYIMAAVFLVSFTIVGLMFVLDALIDQNHLKKEEFANDKE